MDLNLKGKAAIVTGAGRGIGRAIALRLAQEGASVVVSDIDLGAAEQVSRSGASLGFKSLALKADVTKLDEVEKMVAQTLKEFGKIDILINNAGIVYEAGGPLSRKRFEESSPEDWRKEIDIIVYGTLYCTRAVIGHMIKQRSGRIVNIASDIGRTGMGAKGYSIYSATKGGVIALTRSIAIEVANYGITINTVSPGLVRTTKASLAEKLTETRPEEYQQYENKLKSQIEAIPLGKRGEPDDVGKLVVFLSSEAASWITGQTYSVNGGQVMI